jgi:uncharacterized membrane protein YkvA (DUF1232 family)
MSSIFSLDSLRYRVKDLRRDVYSLYLARGDPRIPWYVKAVLFVTVAYALSPVDLIPDFIPVLGYLDDLIIVPAGIALIVRLIPGEILDEYRKRAVTEIQDTGPFSRAGLLLILLIWLVILLLAAKYLLRAF